jgi:Domain of unknown function (DUF1841)
MSKNSFKDSAMQNIDPSGNRKRYYNIWRRYKSSEPLEGEESTIAELMALHKDWYHFWESPDFERTFDPETDEFNPFLHITFDTIVMNQIKNKEPEQIRFTYNKLTARGDSHLEAIHKIAYVFTQEFFPVMKDQKEFNNKRYIRKLKELK